MSLSNEVGVKVNDPVTRQQRKAKNRGQLQSAGCPFFLAGDPTLLTRCNQYLFADLLREPFMQGAWSKIPPWGTPCRASCDALSVDIVNHHGEASCLGPRAIVFNRVFYALPSAIRWKMGPLQRGDCPFLLYPGASIIAPRFLRQQRVKGQPMQPQLPPGRQHR